MPFLTINCSNNYGPYHFPENLIPLIILRAMRGERLPVFCRVLDEMLPDSPNWPHEKLIDFVTDRPGHDARYAIDASKIRGELGWQPRHTFDAGLRDTVRWFLDHKVWWERIMSGAYRGERLGLPG